MSLTSSMRVDREGTSLIALNPMAKFLRKIRLSFFNLGKVPLSHPETFFFPRNLFE